MQSSVDEAHVIHSYALFVQGQYHTVAARVLFLWDYFITLDREVEYIWKSRFSAASGLFFLNRYLNLLITILELIVQAPFLTPESCVPLVRVLQSLLILATFVVGLFMYLRVYATWSRDWRPALPVLILALVTPIAYLYTDIVGDPIPAPRPSVGCAIRTNIEPLVYSIITIVERATTTTYDLLVLLFTVMKTAQARKTALSLDIHPSIMTLLLRDGTTYFVLLFTMNLAQIIVASRVIGTNFITFFASPLTSILITRFLLNLRQVAHDAERRRPPTDGSRSAIISTHFPSLSSQYSDSDYIDDLGGPLRSDFDDLTEVDFEDKMAYVDGDGDGDGTDGPLLDAMVRKSEVRPEEVEMTRFA